MKSRSFDSHLVLDHWPALDVSPGDDFAARVLSSYDAPSQVRAPRRLWPLYACAVAVLGLLAPLLGTPRSTGHGSAPMVAHAPDLDLGLQTD